MNLRDFIVAQKKAGIKALVIRKMALLAYEGKDAEIDTELRAEFSDYTPPANDDNNDNNNSDDNNNNGNANNQSRNAGNGNSNGDDDNNNQNQNAADQARNFSIEVSELCDIAGTPEKVSEYLRSGWDLKKIREVIMKNQRDSSNPMGPGETRISVTADARDKFRESNFTALALRCGMDPKHLKNVDEVEAAGIRGQTLMEIATEAARMDGMNIRSISKSRDDIIQSALFGRGGIGQTGSDFAIITSNVAAKFAAIAYQDAPVTYPLWTGKGSLGDFKQTDVVKLSNFGDLEEWPESTPPRRLNAKDAKETAQLKTFGGTFVISRQAMINDNLLILSRTPTMIARTARRKINQLVYDVLNSNQVITEDATALFDAGHSNLGTAGVIATGTVGELRKLIRLQKGPNDVTLSLLPKFFLVPAALETTALQFLSANVPVVHQKGSDADPFRGLFEIVIDPELDNGSSDAYYVAADPNMIDTVTVFLLNGQDSPQMRRQDNIVGGPQGICWEIFIDTIARAIDFRGLAKNAGV